MALPRGGEWMEGYYNRLPGLSSAWSRKMPGRAAGEAIFLCRFFY
jgi:hypothetical protein